MTNYSTKKITRIFAIIMAVVLLALSMPTGIFATTETLPNSDISQLVPTESSDTLTENGGVDTTEVIGEYVEDLSRREENVKHFALPDGTYTAIVYPTAVHRKDADGVWQDIDNDLSLATVNGSQKYATSDARVSFSQNYAQSNQLMTLSENGYTISMSLLRGNDDAALISADNVSLAAPIITNSVKKELPKTDVKLEDVARIDNKSSIIYSNVKTNTDIEYILDGNSVKENIIVKTAASRYEYTFELRLTGLVAELQQNGSIAISDATTNKQKYEIPAPYMYDANGDLSYAVEYTLIEISSGRYLLAVTADEAWINAAGREFPVTIDPTITYSANVVDTYISFTNEGASYDGMSELWVGSDNNTYIKMDMPGLPDGATFIDATLFVYYYYNISYGSMLVGAYEPVDDWSENISLNIAPGYNIPAISTCVLSASSSISYSDPGIAGFDVTELAEGWYSDPSSNYGVVLCKINDSQHTNQSVILRAFESWEDCSFIAVDYALDIPEGVYALENVSLYDYWMMVANDSIVPGSSIRYDLLDESPVSTFDRSSLFKISEKGSTERYVIRSMLNNRLGIGVVNGELVTKLLPASDDAVPDEDTFHVVWSGYGYHIKTYNTELYVAGSDTGIGDDLNLVDESNAYFNARWNLHRYTTANRSEIVLDVPSNLMAGKKFELSAYSWSTFVDCNVVNISVHSESTGLASIEWVNEQKVELTLHDEGTLKISKTISYPSGTVQISHTPVYNISLPIEEGTYFIRNVQLGNYMQLDDNGDHNNDETIMELHEFDNESYQKWNIEHIGDGFYKIVSVKSGKALTAPSVADNSLTQSEYNQADNKKWEIISSGSGMYKLVPKSNPFYYMAAGAGSDTLPNGRNVEMRAWQEDNKDEWNMCRCTYLFVNHYYDQGLVARANNINANALECIIAAQDIVAQRYMEIFNLEIIPTYSAYTSPADTCKIQQFGAVNHSQLAEPCIHESLHTTGSCLCENLGVATPTQTNAIWTGHILHNGEPSNSYMLLYSVIIEPWLSDPNDTVEEDPSLAGMDEPSEFIHYASYLLLHEIGHQLGAYDHYCYGKKDIDGDGNEDSNCENPWCDECVYNYSGERTCVMKNAYNTLTNLSNEEMFCDMCVELISNHVSDHH